MPQYGGQQSETGAVRDFDEFAGAKPNNYKKIPKDRNISVYPIHTEIFAPKINEINFIPVRDCWLLIGRTVFVTSEKYRPTNHRPRTALCH